MSECKCKKSTGKYMDYDRDAIICMVCDEVIESRKANNSRDPFTHKLPSKPKEQGND